MTEIVILVLGSAALTWWLASLRKKAQCEIKLRRH